VASDSTTSPLAYNAGEDAAKIEVEVVADGNGLVGTELTLAVSAAAMSDDEGTATTANFNKLSNTAIAMDLVTGIAADEIVTDKTVTYALGGTAPSTDGNRTVDLKFTITDGPVPTPLSVPRDVLSAAGLPSGRPAARPSPAVPHTMPHRSRCAGQGQAQVRCSLERCVIGG
jgi:hypothetical protein